MAIGIGEIVILLVVVVFGLGGTALWIWAIVDCATREPPGSERLLWLLVVVLGGWIGALVYLIVRRPRRGRGAVRDR